MAALTRSESSIIGRFSSGAAGVENPASIPLKHKTKIRFPMESPFGEWDARLVPGALGGFPAVRVKWIAV